MVTHRDGNDWVDFKRAERFQLESTVRMLKANFEAAIQMAILYQVRRDAAAGLSESTFTAGLREVLEASQRGETVTVEER
jgi:hypothetical protein